MEERGTYAICQVISLYEGLDITQKLENGGMQKDGRVNVTIIHRAKLFHHSNNTVEIGRVVMVGSRPSPSG